MTEIVFGVDVSKGWIDSVGPSGHKRVALSDLVAFAARVAAVGGRVVFGLCSGRRAGLRRLCGARWLWPGLRRIG